jgi:hypothetical protein
LRSRARDSHLLSWEKAEAPYHAALVQEDEQLVTERVDAAADPIFVVESNTIRELPRKSTRWW